MKSTLAIGALFLFTGFPGRLVACSCVGQRTVEEELKHADAVIVGTILSKQIVMLTDAAMLEMFPGDTNAPTHQMAIARYTLFVEDVYKGRITQDTLVVYTGLGGGDCGIRFETGKKYIVYGENEAYFGKENFDFPKAKIAFWTHSCLRTTAYSPEEIAAIGKYAKRGPVAGDRSVFDNPDSPPVFRSGGDAGLQKFVAENLRYPEGGACVTGKVYVGFTVDTLGNVKDIVIQKGIAPAVDEEAIRVVKMLTFIPATRSGRPVETTMVLPVSFAAEREDK